ncbi:6-hydroxymethylpterin diphosphokinase MptE-like protein [Thalassolituus oleivorans]|uniref:motility associated factor glycosyltransferase family protein n=1 Tax=Thalassolituus oleivorans TaxID=187493 RepID=UPI00240949D8|nr:6-hydroxymethylpterin diphosphokinase MptE-like protein [Thalassolituus oleivorans]MDF1642019.1 DUF115 domain-containing protein [Thalassolituus oleivorans]
MAYSRAQNAINLKDSNLAYFKARHPAIYKNIKDHDFERLTLNIDGETDKVDLWHGTTSLYGGDAVAYAEREVAAFKSGFSEGSLIKTIAPPYKGNVGFCRFFSKRLQAVIQTAPQSTNFNDQYVLPDFYPLVLFMGCGLGLQIEKMLETSNVLNVIIFEPDPEYFYASLYVVDWHKLFKSQIDQGRRIDIIFADHLNENPAECANVIWNSLINYCPSFPLGSLFYTHLNGEKYDETIAKIRDDMHFFLNQWGYYDDEINQLNNAYHNLSAGIPPLNGREISSDIPTVVVGGGPSLDHRIDEIKANRDKILLISCGTAVHSLLAEGITPDIHVEIESHMLTFESLANAKSKDFFEKTLLIGALQLPPNVFELFKNKVYFIKDSSALASLFAQPEDIIRMATPTCTNTGLAIATHLKCSEVYLYGMDFGFSEVKNHHSKTSIYYTSEMSQAIRDELKRTFDHVVEVESVFGETIYSIPMYCTSRKSAENCSLVRGKLLGLKTRNCSEGAKVNGADYIDKEALLEQLKDREKADIENLKSRLIGIPIPKNKIREKIDYLGSVIKTTSRELSIHLMENCEPTLQNVFQIAHKINRYMLEQQFPKYDTLCYTFRGSIWHFLNTGAGIAWSIPNLDERKIFITTWKEAFKSYLNDVGEHYTGITSKEYPDPSDPWIKEDIVSNEHLYAE